MPKNRWPPFAFNEESAWGACLKSFYRRYSQNQNTLKKYRQTLTRFFTEPALMPDRYTREHVETFIHAECRAIGRVGNPPSPGTMNNRLAALNSFYEYAGGYGVIGEDGFLHPIMQRMSPTSGLHHIQQARAYRSISYADFERFFSVIPTNTVIGLRHRALFLMYFWTARRASEIVSLRWRDLEQTTLIEDGVPRQGWIYHYHAKGRKLVDAIAELPQPAKDALDRYLIASGRMGHMEGDDPLFIAGRGNPKSPLSVQSVWYAVKQYAAKAGIDPTTITTHSFRHAAAQFRTQAGQDLVSVSHLLGHASVGTTHIYLQGLVSQTDAGAKLLQEKFGKF